MNEPDHTIINRYGAEYRGIVQYYLLAGDVYRLDRLHWVMQTSLLKTLAGKYGSTVTKMARRYRATIETPHGPHKCLQVSVERGKGRKPLVATFGGIPLIRQKHAVLKDREPVPAAAPRKELIDRLLAGRCETLRATGRGASPPDPQALRPRQARTARPTRMGQDHGSSGDARPSWSAPPATPRSTPGGQPRQSRNSRWRAR